MQLTVTEAAKLADVSEKTIRVWITEGGCPLIREGAKGPNQGAIIDGARFPAWLHTKRFGFRAESQGDRMQQISSLPNGGNPFRWLAEYQHAQTVAALGAAWRSFLDDGHGKEWGLTEAQARTVAWRAWSWCAMFLKVHLVDGEFEKALKRDTESDLDDMASFLFASDFRTAWSDLDHIECPRAIAELVPADVAARLAEGDNVRTLPTKRARRRPKGNGRA